MKTLALIAILGTVTVAQAPAFDAVSIKINTSGEQNSQFGGRPGGIQVRNNTLRSIIRNIWNLNGLQIVGGPPWIDDTRFDILATAAGNPNRDQMISMAKTMMADRFKLVVHTETRPIPVYALVLARPDGQLGPNLRRSSLTNCNPATPPAPGTPPPPAPPPLAGVDIPACGTNTNSGILRAGGVRLDAFTRNMANAAGRIIVDKTGLTGPFDMILRFNPDPNNPSSDLPTLFAAVQEQLGLKFEAQTAPTEVLVIDSAEKPTEN
jgi:uncharacterized protein (TIGR03435 family)